MPPPTRLPSNRRLTAAEESRQEEFEARERDRVAQNEAARERQRRLATMRFAYSTMEDAPVGSTRDGEGERQPERFPGHAAASTARYPSMQPDRQPQRPQRVSVVEREDLQQTGEPDPLAITRADDGTVRYPTMVVDEDAEAPPAAPPEDPRAAFEERCRAYRDRTAEYEAMDAGDAKQETWRELSAEYARLQAEQIQLAATA